MPHKHSKHIGLAIELLFFALLFCAPLFFDRSIGIVFSLSKATLIRSFTVIILALWATRLLLDNGGRFTRTLSDIPALTYFLACTAATLLSINVYVSFFGSYGRYEGLITIGNYVALFFLASNLVNAEGMLKKLIVCAVSSGALMSVYGMIQRMGLDPFVWGGVITNERVISTIGQPNFLAAYLDMSFMLGMGVLLFAQRSHAPFFKKENVPLKKAGKNQKRKKPPLIINWEEILFQARIFLSFPAALLLFVYMIFSVDGITAPVMWVLAFVCVFSLLIYFVFRSPELDSRLLKAAVAFSMVLAFISVLFTQSRGGLLGLLCGGILVLIFAGRQLLFSKWKELSIISAVMLIVLVSMFTFSRFSPMNRIRQEVSLSAEERGPSRIEFRSAAGSRLETWKSAFAVMAERPVLGLGPEVIKMMFPQYETSQFRFKEGFHVKQDRCHNEILDTAITKGMLSLFIYAWFLGGVFYAGLKKLGQRDETSLLVGACLAAILSYIVQNQFSFGVVAIGSLFWVLLGAVAGVSSGNPRELGIQIKNGALKTALLLSIWAVAVFLALVSFIPYLADYHFKAAKIISGSDYQRAVKEHQKSIALSPFEGGYYTNYGITILNTAGGSGDPGAMKEAIAVLERGSRVDPYNADNFYMMGRASLFLAQTGQKEQAETAKNLSRRALKVDPYYAEAYQNLAVLAQIEGKEEEAMGFLEKAFEANPTMEDISKAVSSYYLRKGDVKGLLAVYDRLLSLNPDDVAILTLAGNVHLRAGDNTRAGELFDTALSKDPLFVQALVGKAEVLFRTGRSQESLSVLQSGLMIDPSNPVLHTGLGDYYLKAGDKTRAREEFEQALYLDGSSQYARQMLERLK